MIEVYLSLGSNIGDSYLNIKTAIEKINKSDGIEVMVISAFYTTEPWGKTDQNDFLNCVVKIETDYSPWYLLRLFQEIEKELGKDIKIRWGERTIDIDIILYGQKIIYEKKLIIPHPRYHKRNFVLIPLCDISDKILDPYRKALSGELLQVVKDKNKVKLFNEN